MPNDSGVKFGQWRIACALQQNDIVVTSRDEPPQDVCTMLATRLRIVHVLWDQNQQLLGSAVHEEIENRTPHLLGRPGFDLDRNTAPQGPVESGIATAPQIDRDSRSVKFNVGFGEAKNHLSVFIMDAHGLPFIE